MRAPRLRGIVLIVTLIALTVTLLGAMALMRSFGTTQATAGNVGFKRDLAHQAERAVMPVMAALRTGALATPAARAAHRPAENYSASLLPVNAQGVPLDLLLSDAAFQARWNRPDLAVTDGDGADMRVTLRWVVDRLCDATGDETALGDRCLRGADPVRGGSSLGPRAEDTAAPVPVLYRLSVRVTGPRGTQSFFQTTFSL